MRGVFEKCSFKESTPDSFPRVFLVFYLTRAPIFVNPSRAAREFNSCGRRLNWPRNTPQ